MSALVRLFLRMRALILILLACMLVAGTFGALKLDVEAYPDPSPPLVEIITQNPAWSAEEMEQQVTVHRSKPLINGVPHLDQESAPSAIFGLSDVKLYFTFGSGRFPRPPGSPQPPPDPHPVAQQPAAPAYPPGPPSAKSTATSSQGPGYTLNDLIKATQDWLVRRELKQVPGIIDITTFGGHVRSSSRSRPIRIKLMALRHHAAAGDHRCEQLQRERRRQLHHAG